jgi:hypothetical protein
MGDPLPDAAAPQARLRMLGSQWTAMAEDAFSGVAHSPERYMAAARLVAAWLERLRSLPPGLVAGPEASGPGALRERDDEAAVSALVAAWDARDSRAAADGMALPVTAAERTALTAAAFAIRYAEVANWLALRGRRRAMAKAAADLGGWVVLEESGDAAGDLFITYRRLEVDCMTGLGVLVGTRPDDGFTGVIHEIRLISVDPLTGELNDDYCGKTWEFCSETEREEHVTTLRSHTDRAPWEGTG